ncbi:MAG: Rieske (2Fe-2S) protein [Ilumatobacter sp.]|uniref:Rieske (2Fe-2S) protein n=1 Tax=Ilumatobacter sp. TaxID=1967498 RepID=UPI00329A2359
MPEEKSRPRQGPAGFYLIEMDGEPNYVVATREDGSYVAFLERCPHAKAPFNHTGYVEEGLFRCSLHDFYYSLDTGEAVDFDKKEDPGCLNLLRVEREGDQFAILFP